MEEVCDVEGWVRERAWETRSNGEWITVRRCPLCQGGQRGDQWTFAINRSSGGSVCHRKNGCDWSGSLRELRARLGESLNLPSPVVTSPVRQQKQEHVQEPTLPTSDLWRIPHERLVADEVLMMGLAKSRGLSRETVERYGVGAIKRGPGDKPLLVFSYRDREGRTRYIKKKGRTEDGGKEIFREPRGTSPVLFGEWLLKGRDRIVVVEGEEDAMLLAQHGVHNVVSLPDGANVSTSNPPVWIETLKAFDDVVIALDDDGPGKIAASNLREILGREHATIVSYPAPMGEEKDATDYWRSGRIDELVRSIDDANQSVLLRAGSLGVRDRILRQYREEMPLGFSTGWKSIDGLLGGIRKSELTIVTAHTGAGKSALAANVALNAARADRPAMIAALEISVEDAVWRLLQQIVGRFPWERRDAPGLAMSEDDLADGFDQLQSMPLHLLNHWGSMDADAFCEAVRISHRKHKLELVILDHLHFMCAGAGDDYLGEIASAIKKLKSLAVELDLSIWVVCHANRSARSKEEPSITDLYGSSALEQIADNVITMARLSNLETTLYGGARVTLAKLRAGRCGRQGFVELGFSRAAERFYDLSDPPTDGGETVDAGEREDDEWGAL